MKQGGSYVVGSTGEETRVEWTRPPEPMPRTPAAADRPAEPPADSTVSADGAEQEQV